MYHRSTFTKLREKQRSPNKPAALQMARPDRVFRRFRTLASLVSARLSVTDSNIHCYSWRKSTLVNVTILVITDDSNGGTAKYRRLEHNRRTGTDVNFTSATLVMHRKAGE